jgi:hypothetical protein
VIIAPINDVDCLAQLTTIVRELARTMLVRLVARHLGTREAVIEWLQLKPQDDDDGRELVQFMPCDVPQRLRLFADAPNCVERASDAAILLEALEQMQGSAPTTRALATIDHPVRHTGLVEKSGAHWYAVDLFPRKGARRNSSWIDQVATGVQGVHQYVGKPLLDFYLGKSAGDAAAGALGGGEKTLFATVGTKKPAPEKQPAPPVGTSATAQLARPGAAVASNGTSTQGGANGGQTETRKPDVAGSAAETGAATVGVAASGEGRAGAGAGQGTAAGDDNDSYDEGAEAQRGSGGWWGF